jgi:hypothetical protein
MDRARNRENREGGGVHFTAAEADGGMVICRCSHTRHRHSKAEQSVCLAYDCPMFRPLAEGSTP